MTKLNVFTALVLRHPTDNSVLLLKRSETKKRWPGYITGIGGMVELCDGEAEDLIASTLRELDEETRIPLDQVANVQLRLSTIVSRGEVQNLLLWLTGQLLSVPEDLFSPDGVLTFYPLDELPFEQMIPTARVAIPFITSLAADDIVTYNGVFVGDELFTTMSEL